MTSDAAFTTAFATMLAAASKARAAGRPMNLRGRLRTLIKARRLTPAQAAYADKLEAAINDPMADADPHVLTSMLIAEINLFTRPEKATVEKPARAHAKR